MSSPTPDLSNDRLAAAARLDEVLRPLIARVDAARVAAGLPTLAELAAARGAAAPDTALPPADQKSPCGAQHHASGAANRPQDDRPSL